MNLDSDDLCIIVFFISLAIVVALAVIAIWMMIQIFNLSMTCYHNATACQGLTQLTPLPRGTP